MKVIFILHSHTAGGAERHLLQLMQGLSASGITCIFAGPADGWLGKQLKAAGLRCVPISLTGLFDLVSFFRLVRLIISEKADLIHGHLTRGAYYAGLASALTNVPNVATAHSTNAGKRFGRARRIIAVSDAVNRFLAGCGYPRDIIRTVLHGVPNYAADPHIPRSAMGKELQLDQGPVLVMVARFVPAKGHDIALHALATIKKKTWTLVLAGSLDTTYAKAMLQLAQDLGIADRVRFVGHRDDVGNIYSCADILLAPSRREALSLTLLEAAAFGIPIVATDVGGISEAVEDGVTGLLAPPDDTLSLSKHIAHLLDNPDIRVVMGAAGRQRYERLFAVENMTRATITVYNEIALERLT